MVQVHLEFLENKELLVDNLEDQVVIHRDRDFQDAQAVLNQGDNSLAFHQVQDLRRDILVDDHRFHFRAVNQQEGQERVPVYRVDQKDFQQGQVVDILVADLVGKDQVDFQVRKDLPDTRVVGPTRENQVLDILLVDRVDKDQVKDTLAVKLLEVISVKYKSLVARKVDILVEGQELTILEVLKDHLAVQAFREDIQEEQMVSKVLVHKVDPLLAAILVVDQKRKDQEVIQAAQVRKDQEDFQVG